MAGNESDLANLDWNDLRFVLAVSRDRSLTAAGRTLGVSHSTVFRRLRAVEQALQVQLFERLPSGYVPTDQGAEVVALARDFEGGLERAHQKLRLHSEQLRGTITLTTFEGIGLWVADRMVEFRERYPEIQLVLDVSWEMREVRPGRADVALWLTATPPEHLVGRAEGKVAYAVYGHRDRFREISPEAPWITLDESRRNTGQWTWERDNVPKDRVALEVGSRALFLDLVRRGVGIGVVPCALAEPIDELVRLSDPIPELVRPLWLLVNGEATRTARRDALVGFLRDALMDGRPSLDGSNLD